MPGRYDAVLLVSFGGPEGTDEVMPFLRQVVRGRDVPEERLREVATHYQHFGGRSPLNDRCRALVAALRGELDRCGPRLPVYWGNRNWRPFLADTLRAMAADGVRRALAFVTSAFGSYPGCRQYLEDIERARAAVGPAAPEVHKLRAYYDHPGYVEPLAESVAAAFERVPAERRARAALAFTAHSVPRAVAAASPYEAQLRETARLVAAGAARLAPREAQQPCSGWSLVYQSRSGPPAQPWLEPDILDHLRSLAAAGVKDVVVSPIGFVADNLEVLYDLDLEAHGRALELGVNLVRAATAGSHPRFVTMIRELVEERLSDAPVRLHLGSGPAPDNCAAGCCPAPAPAGARSA